MLLVAMILSLGISCSITRETNKRSQFMSCLGTGIPSFPLQKGKDLSDQREPRKAGALGRQTSTFTFLEPHSDLARYSRLSFCILKLSIRMCCTLQPQSVRRAPTGQVSNLSYVGGFRLDSPTFGSGSWCDKQTCRSINEGAESQRFAQVFAQEPYSHASSNIAL